MWEANTWIVKARTDRTSRKRARLTRARVRECAIVRGNASAAIFAAGRFPSRFHVDVLISKLTNRSCARLFSRVDYHAWRIARLTFQSETPRRAGVIAGENGRTNEMDLHNSIATLAKPAAFVPCCSARARLSNEMRMTMPLRDGQRLAAEDATARVVPQRRLFAEARGYLEA